jgi:ABC-type nitrate/sulfonate/bicarbonate transport system substrate-binding protein
MSLPIFVSAFNVQSLNANMELAVNQKLMKSIDVDSMAASATLTSGSPAGKRASVGLLNSISHIHFIDWMRRNGGDAKTVQLTEIPFPQMPDALTTFPVAGFTRCVCWQEIQVTVSYVSASSPETS